MSHALSLLSSRCRWYASLLWLMTAALAGNAAAEEVSRAETRAVRAVIEAQLAALAADDASRAFSYASPAIRKQVGSAGNFLAMVRGSYPMVYRPSSVVFLAPQRIEGQLLQGVQMTDAAGAPWLAVYTMERQADKSWRIAGCRVRSNEGHAT